MEQLNDVRGKKIYAIVNHVSKSGMQRQISFYFVNKQGEIQCINGLIAKVLDMKTKNGIVVNGCGMDMVFSVLSNLNYAMAKIDTGKSLNELLESKECGERIYDKYFIDANRYQLL